MGKVTRAAHRFACDPSCVSAARQLAIEMLDDVDAPAEVRDDITLALGEICANAVRHAQGSQVFDVAIEVGESGCAVEVQDWGPGIRDLLPTGEDLESENGRGLAIVRSVTDDLASSSSTHGTRLRFTRTW